MSTAELRDEVTQGEVTGRSGLAQGAMLRDRSRPGAMGILGPKHRRGVRSRNDASSRRFLPNAAERRLAANATPRSPGSLADHVLGEARPDDQVLGARLAPRYPDEFGLSLGCFDDQVLGLLSSLPE
jgi:hypothetical protein